MRRVAGLFVLLSSCWSTTFQATDPAYRRAAARAPVEVYLDLPPARAYRQVGLIAVDPPSSSARGGDIVAHAVAKAREVGCDVLVARGGRTLQEPSTGRQLSTPGVAQLGPVPGETIGGGEGGSHVQRFVCGVWAAPPSQ